MKAEFYEKLNKLMSRKKGNQGYLMNAQRYQELIQEVKFTKIKRLKDFNDYKLLSNFDIINLGGRERLILPKSDINTMLKIYLSVEDLFSSLHTVHLLNNHANKDKMDVRVKVYYCNVPKEAIKLYLSCCNVCKEQEK